MMATGLEEGEEDRRVVGSAKVKRGGVEPVEEVWPVCMGNHGSVVDRGESSRDLEWRPTKEEVVVV
jgi:hypothetical protein